MSGLGGDILDGLLLVAHVEDNGDLAGEDQHIGLTGLSGSVAISSPMRGWFRYRESGLLGPVWYVCGYFFSSFLLPVFLRLRQFAQEQADYLGVLVASGCLSSS